MAPPEPRQSTRLSLAPSLYVAEPASASLSTPRLPPVEGIPNSASPVGVTSTAPSVAVAPPSTSEPAPLRNHPLFQLPDATIAHRVMLSEPACSPEQEGTEEQVTRTPLQATQYGENPVFRNGSFKRRRVDGVWRHIKYIKDPILRNIPNELNQLPTHVCTYPGCWMRLRMSFDKKKGVFLTTEGLKHFRSAHEDDPTSKKSQVQANGKKLMLVAGMLNAGLGPGIQPPRLEIPRAGKSLDDFYVPPAQMAISRAARFYVYGKGRISKATFNDPEFRGMCQGFYEAGGGTGEAPFLTNKGLIEFVRAEFEIFKTYLKFMVKQGYVYSEGNPFMQGQHDCVTLANHKKYLAFGLEFIDEDLDSNHAVAIAMIRIKDGTDATCAGMLNKICEEMTGAPYKELCHSTISDRAAIGVAGQFGQDGDGCGMHDTDKIGKSMTGDLTRSQNRVAINPFPEGQRLMAQIQALAVHFSYGKRLEELHDLGKKIPEGIPRIRFKIDHCGTRVSARRFLMKSVIRQNKATKLYALANKSSWALTETQWNSVPEFYSLLSISADVATLDQTETKFTTALSVPMKMRMMAQFRADTLNVVDLEEVTASPKLPRVEKNVNNLTRVGKMAKFRATLESERRFCGNTTEKLNGAPVEFTVRDELSVLLDARTNNDEFLLTDSTFRHKCKDNLRDFYVEYGLRAQQYHRDLKPCSTIVIPDEDNTIFTPTTATTVTEVWSDDSESEDDRDKDETNVDDDVIAERAREASIQKLRVEFESCFKRYRKRSSKIDWRIISKSLQLDLVLPEGDGRIELMDLWDVHMGKVMNEIFINADENKELYGYLPQMATHSRGSIGAYTASSFAERINSAANLVLTNGNSLMNSEEINMLSVLRVNRGFMEYMRKKYPDVSGQHFRMTVVSDSMNDEN